MSAEQPYIHSSSFRPFQNGAFHLSPSHARLYASIFGVRAWKNPEKTGILDFLRGQSQLSLEEILPDTLDTGFLADAGLGEYFPSQYIKAQKDALNARQIVVNFLGLPQNLIGGSKDEVLPSENIKDNLLKIFNPNYSDKVRFEMTLAQLFAFEALSNNNKKKTEKHSTMRSNFINWLDNNIFVGKNEKKGQDHPVTVHSLHNPETFWNSGETRLDRPYKTDEIGDMMYKESPLTVRYCSLDGKEYKILLESREKRDGDSLLKALRKALLRKNLHDVRIGSDIKNLYEKVGHITREEESDRLRLSDDVTDLLGTKFVVVEGDRDEFMQSLESRLTFFGRVVVRDQTNKTKNGNERGGSQSKRHTFKRRILPDYAHFEVIVYSLQEYLNSEYDIGNRKETGELDGASHEIFAATRIAEIARIMFPKEIYPEIDIEEYIKRVERRVVGGLWEKNTRKRGYLPGY